MRGNCAICGIFRERLHRDHIIPSWRGGANTQENRQHICANCHQDKTYTDTVELREKHTARISNGGDLREKINKILKTPKTRMLMSISQKKRYENPDARAQAKIHLDSIRQNNIAALKRSLTGKPRSAETRAKISAGRKGLAVTMETRNKLSNAQRERAKERDAFDLSSLPVPKCK